MSDAFESEVMDDLFYDSAEGPARPSYGDEFEELDELEDEFEGFEDEFEEADELEDYGDEMEALDSMEDAVADALEEEDADEFFRRLGRIARRVGRGVGRVARRVAPVVGRIARTVAPIASVIPIPQAQAIGRIAGVLGRVLPADELDALDEVIDLAEEEDAVDAAAPLIAGLAVRRAIPGAARQPLAARRQLVRSATQATRTLARRGGPQAARAIPRVLQGVQRAARRRGLPARALPRAVQRTAARVAQSPAAVRRLAGAAARRPMARMGMARMGMARTRRGTGGPRSYTPRSYTPRTYTPRSYTLRGPVRISIQGY